MKCQLLLLSSVFLKQAIRLSLGRYDLGRMRKTSSWERENVGPFLDWDRPCTCEPSLVLRPNANRASTLCQALGWAQIQGRI